MTAFEAWLDRIAYVQWALVPLVVAAGIGATVARSRAATRTGLATVLLAAMLVPFFVPVLRDPGAALDATRRDFAATPYSRAVDVPLHETSTGKASPPSVAHGSGFSPVRFRIPTWLWMTGTMLLAARALAGIVRTRRRLRGMPDAPNDVLREVGSIAEDLVVRAPRCVLSNERCSPAVYCLGAPVLVLPAALWRSLDTDARRALLVHELAHVKRRDGLLRAVAGVASCLVWWNPVVWWLRARLRANSEDACDAWVGAIDDEAPTTFTRALLETERFLGGVPLRPRPALIPVASGKARALGRRLRRIVEVAPHRASGLGVSFVAVLALAASTTGWIGVQATAPARANAADGVDDALALGRSLGLREVIGRLLLRVEGETDPARLPEAVTMLREAATVEERRLAADAIGNFFERGTGGVPALLDALAKDPSPSVRREAVDAIGRIGPHIAAEVLASLYEARRHDSSSRVRREVDDVLERWELE